MELDEERARRPRWSPGARRLGVTSAAAVFAVGVTYLVVIGVWLAVERKPAEPIGDPYLAAMEALTIASATALVGLVVAVHRYAAPARPRARASTIGFGLAAACATIGVHVVQLTVVRQAWRDGAIADYRLVWPSTIFAVEYLAWDVFVGLAMTSASVVLPEGETRRAARVLFAGGVSCLLGTLGPVTGRMAFQNLAVFGYAVLLPVAALLLAGAFLRTPSWSAEA